MFQWREYVCGCEQLEVQRVCGITTNKGEKIIPYLLSSRNTYVTNNKFDKGLQKVLEAPHFTG